MSVEKAKDFLKIIEQNEQLITLRKEFTSEELSQAVQEMALDDVTGGISLGDIGRGIVEIFNSGTEGPSSVPDLV